MSELIGFTAASRSSRNLQDSALPNAPIVDDTPSPQRIRASRRWFAARLRGMARGTYHLANRVDPVCLPTGHGAVRAG